MKLHPSAVAIFCFAIFFAVPARLLAVGASGYSTQLMSVKALGLANAFVAEADDPTAVYFNPAGLTQLSGWQVTLGATDVLLETDYQGQGVSESMDSEWTLLPHLFLSGALKDKLSLGFGLSVPFGLSTKWSKTGFSRYVATESNLETLHYNPSIAYSFTSKLSLGAGIDYLSVNEVSLESQINQAGLNMDLSPDGTQKLEGKGGEWGYNFGALYKPVENHSLGLAYRSQFRVHIKGDIKLSGLSGSTRSNFNFPSADYTAHAQTDLIFPQSLMVGYYYLAPSKRWTLLVDYEWTDWSVNKKTDISFDETDPTRSAVLNAANPTPRNWDDVHAIAIGSDYKFRNGLILRLGYSYIPRTVPDSTWDPSLPDSDQHTLSNGLGYSWKDVTLDFAYNLILFNNRRVDNTIGNSSGASVNGKYETSAQVVGLSLTYKFFD